MNARAAWLMILAACAGATLAGLLRSERQSAKRVHNDELQQWENEGGNLAPSPEAAAPS